MITMCQQRNHAAGGCDVNTWCVPGFLVKIFLIKVSCTSSCFTKKCHKRLTGSAEWWLDLKGTFNITKHEWCCSTVNPWTMLLWYPTGSVCTWIKWWSKKGEKLISVWIYWIFFHLLHNLLKLRNIWVITKIGILLSYSSLLNRKKVNNRQ